MFLLSYKNTSDGVFSLGYFLMNNVTSRKKQLWKVLRTHLKQVLLIRTVFSGILLMGDVVASWLVSARLLIERSGFQPWPETLHYVLGQDTLLSQGLSSSKCITWYRRA